MAEQEIYCEAYNRLINRRIGLELKPAVRACNQRD
jgi:hypothetical protein